MNRRWQWIIAVALTLGYAGYYFGRSNFSVVQSLMVDDLGGQGLTIEYIGLIASLGTFAYFIGKFVNGVIADFLGGRAVFFLAMALSVVLTVFAGVAATPVAFAIFWCLNRYVQSAGWPALVKVASRSFSHAWQGSALGFISVSYLAGDAVARAYFSQLVALEFGWRGVFFAAAAALALIALIAAALIVPAPEMRPEEQGEHSDDHLFHKSADDADSRQHTIWQHLRIYARSPRFWLVAVMSFALTFVRETFNFWSAPFLKETAGMSAAGAILGSAVFPVAGIVSTLAAGFLSDHVARRKRAWVIVPGLALGLSSLLALYLFSEGASAALLMVLIGLSALFLIGPYSLLSGAMAVDLGGRQGSSTAAGLIDGIGYAAAIASGWGVARLAQSLGWSAVFGVLAGASLLALGAALAYGLLRRPPAEGVHKTGP